MSHGDNDPVAWNPISVAELEPDLVKFTLDADEFYEQWQELVLGTADWSPTVVRHAAYRLSNLSLQTGTRFRPRPTTFSVLKKASQTVRSLVVLGSAHLTNPSIVAFIRLRFRGVRVSLRRPRGRLVGSAHEKFTVSTDGETTHVLVASVDLTPARFDNSRHLKDRPSHETGLFFVSRGTRLLPLMLDRALASTAELLTDRKADSRLRLHVVRSSPRADSDNVRDFGYLKTFLMAIRNARRYIYIEDQFFCPDLSWARSDVDLGEINPLDALCRAVERGVQLIVATNDDASTTGQTVAPLKLIHRARTDAIGRLHQCTGARRPIFLCKTAPDSRSIYTHSKLLLVDDRFLMLGSANVSPRSFLYDNELDVAVVDDGSGFVARCRDQLWNEYHLEQVERLEPEAFENAVALYHTGRQIEPSNSASLTGLQRRFYVHVVDPIVVPHRRNW